MKKFSVFIVTILILASRIFASEDVTNASTWWSVQSVDTMKYSRDLARQKNTDASFDAVITAQVEGIAQTGATHIAIATPYDSDFLPFLTRWVTAARKNNLKVWFRGNWSGWEGWFDKDEITRDQHIKMTEKFILQNVSLFEDGDIFSSCPECENGGPGDPRLTGDVEGHRKFLIDLYTTTKKTFSKIGKQVESNYFSMNGDVAKLIMDPDTTRALDGLLSVDHYVATPQQLNRDITALAESSGGKIVLGEFGAPIPDIHGAMTQKQQSDWLDEALKLLVKNPSLVGLNYWTNVGGSTHLWDEDGKERLAVSALSRYYAPDQVTFTFKNQIGSLVPEVTLSFQDRQYEGGKKGQVVVPADSDTLDYLVSAAGYESQRLQVSNSTKDETIILKKSHESLLFRLQKLIYRLFGGTI